MSTVVNLDVPRTELTELPWGLHRDANQLDTAGGYKNLLKLWPHTQTLTLQPVNLTTAFGRSGDWEALKFRLADVVHDPQWWDERPGINGDDKSHLDYYFHSKVLSTNLPTNFISGGSRLWDKQVDNMKIAVLERILLEEALSTSALRSKVNYPVNQGYLLKFHLEGRPEFADADLLSFYFGNYAVRFSGSGEAILHQAMDDSLQNFAPVFSFPWALESQIHDRFHAVTIFPHARNKIEFLARQSASFGWESLWQFGKRGVNGGGVYTVPGELIRDENGKFVITKAGVWGLRCSKRFRVHLQVSRLGFYSGLDGGAGFFDSPADITFPPNMPVYAMADYDTNGGRIDTSLVNGIDGGPFLSDGLQQTPQFVAQFIGEGDIDCKGGKASTHSPELYGYSLDKSAGFTTYGGEPTTLSVLSVQMDQGDAPDSERLTITLDNSYGQAEEFARRGHIPLTLMDDETGVTYFEGTGTSVTSGEAPGNAVRTLTIEAIGMADNLIRSEWFHSFNFGKAVEPQAEAQGQGWFWNKAVRRAFEAAGVDEVNEVVIEEENAYSFRLWASGGGGPSGGSGVGDGHEPASVKGQPWTPNLLTPVYEWIDFILRDTLGWHWYRDRESRVWRVYKRPDPRNTADAGKFTPKVAFYSTPDDYLAAPDGLPSYEHAHFQTESVRPACTTVNTFCWLNEAQVLTKAELQTALAKVKAGETNPEDPIIETKTRRVDSYANNKRGVIGPKSHPDWLGGKLRVKIIPCWQTTDRASLEWITRRFGDDLTHGYVFGTFVADWGDENTAYLRKWDAVLIDSGRDPVTNAPNYTMEKWLIDRIEPQWTHDNVRRARYRVSLFREDAPPPR